MFTGECGNFRFDKKNQKRVREILKREVYRRTGLIKRWDIPIGEYEKVQTVNIPRTSQQAQEMLRSIIPPEDR